MITRHNEIRDVFGDLSSLAWKSVMREPVVREAEEATNQPAPALVADLLVRGVWYPQEPASFDIRVVDTDASSYLNRTPMAILKSAETEKKTKYHEACTERHTSFTPLVISVDGVMAPECEKFVRHLSERLSYKWNRKYSQIVSWIKTRLSFAIVRATYLCIRGTRSKWRSLGTEDGASFSTER